MVSLNRFVNATTGNFINTGEFDSSIGLIENYGNWDNVAEDQTTSGTVNLSGRFATFLNNGSLNNQTDGRNFQGVSKLEGFNQSHVGLYRNRSVIAPGTKKDPIGTYTFNENLVQESFSSIDFDVNNTANDKIISLSNIELNGALKSNILEDLDLNQGETRDYLILEADGISGEFNQITFPNESLEYIPNLIYQENKVFLRLTKSKVYTFGGSEGLWTDVKKWKNEEAPGTSISNIEIVVINGNVSISDELEIINNGQIIVSKLEDTLDESTLNILGSLVNEEEGSIILKESNNLFLNKEGILENKGEMLLMDKVNFYLKDNKSKLINVGKVLNPKSRTQKNILNNEEIVNSDTALFYIAFSDTLTNNGRVLNSGKLFFDSNSSILNSGIIENEGEISVEFRVNWFNSQNSQFYNKGILKGSRLEVTNNGNWINEESSLAKINLNTIVFENNNILDDYDANNTFTGSFTSLSGVNKNHIGNYTNSTTVSPGMQRQIIGSYTFTNNYIQNNNGVLEVQITGRVSDLLTSQADVFLSGSLEVEIIEPILIEPNSFLDYKIIEGESISGEFNNVKISKLPKNYRYEINRSEEEISIRIFNDSENMLPYIFSGKGSWTDINNWENNRYPGVVILKDQNVIVSGKAIIEQQTTIENNGNISVIPNFAIPASSENGSLNIQGFFNNQANAQLTLKNYSSLSIMDNGILQNEGAINYNRSILIKLNSETARLTNGGRISNANKVSVGSNFVNEGIILNEENGLLFIDDMSFNNNNQIVNDGSVGMGIGGDFKNSGTIKNSGRISIKESSFKNLESGTLYNSGEIYSNSFGSLSSSGNLINKSEGNIDTTENSFFTYISGVFQNEGELNIFSGDAFIFDDFINNGKILIVQADSQGGGGQLTIKPEVTLTNKGEIIIAEGNGAINIRGGDLINEGGTLVNEKEGLITNESRIIQDKHAITINRGSILANTSSHTGTFINESGTLGLGVSSEFIDASQSTYTYELTNGWEQQEDGVLQIRILGATSDKVVSLGGTITLAGELEVDFSTPIDTTTLLEEYVILKAINISGTFKNLDVQNIPENKNFEIVYTDTEVRIKIEDVQVLNTLDNLLSEIKLITDLKNESISIEGLIGKHTLSIYDLHGRKVLENETTAPLTQSVSNLAKGYYILKIDNDQSFYRFVK
ncbi:T9SS type A sorting domain-containing protein [Aquimarina sp. ERC-38]|uniref:T9SS type A sorting domain-containing protein n=1 Tax=Aquimarina sp. ERC-38 TaxID=2949996 RepID=UPI0022462E50|nr:T9SS type A sorting domain-containing protein [Aquimarina sp. ERC-38]UZO81640.1 T9SS type A sorting domain-containing protein [Aquimarina sp. ERC-38]